MMIFIHVAVKEAYLHCTKAVTPAGLWSQEAQVARSVLPTMNEMLQEQIGQTGPVEPQDVMVARHRTQLYSTQ